MVPTITHWIGQDDAIRRFKVALEASWNDGTKLPHMLFVGCPGTGKTLLANLAAKEMGVQLHERIAQVVNSMPALNGLLLLPVGIYPSGPTLEGVHDLAGNVWEWCSDWYGPYTADAQIDPSGPPDGSARVLRGGSFRYDPGGLRAAYRARGVPDYRVDARGFRVAWVGSGGLE